MSSDLYLQKLRSQLGSRYAETTRSSFTSQARRFLDVAGVKPAYSREDMLAYVDKLVLAGYRGTSIMTILGGVRALLYANNIPWPLQKRDLHLNLPDEEEGGPVLSRADVAGMIRGAQGTRVPDLPAVALSTIYGLRATEIAAVISAGCNGKVLEVQTAKGGRKRVHTIPATLRGALTFKAHPMTRDGLYHTFERRIKIVRDPIKGEGWHAIRRALLTELQQTALPEALVHRWFGWRTPPQSPYRIAYRYFRPEAEKMDEQVYAKHPFLPMWE